jgi:Kef-type K+ transport system membrane component KefB
VSWLDHLSARAGTTVLCVMVVGVACAALNFPKTRLAVSAALSYLVAGLVLAPNHPIRPGDRA